MVSDDFTRAQTALESDSDSSLPMLRAIVSLLPRPADLYDAASATRDWLRARGDPGVLQLEALARTDGRWEEVLLSAAAFGPRPNQQWSVLQEAAARARGARGLTTLAPDYVTDLIEASEARRETGERWSAMFEREEGMIRLAAAWCIWRATSWAELDTFNSARKDALGTWDLIVQLARAAPDDAALRQLGAGDPETLIEFHGEMLLPQIEADARSEPKVRRMLCGAWQTTSISDALWARIDALLAEFPPEDREGHGQSPQLQALRARGIWKGVPFPGGEERVAQLLGEAKTRYSDEEIASHVGLTVDQIRAEIDAGTLYGSAQHGYSAPLVAVLARYFPDLPRDVP